MGEIGGKIAENFQSILGFFITWVLPFIVVIGAMWLGYRFKNPKIRSKGKALIIQQSTTSRREALESATIAWGLWHTGTRMRIEKLLELPSLKRVLILEPNPDNPSVGEVAEKSNEKPNTIISYIRDTTNEALNNGIDTRWYFKARGDSLTIYDSTPVEDADGTLKPCSENAWTYIEYFHPRVGVDQRKGSCIYNKGKDKNLFNAYYREYEDIWNDSSKSRQAYRTDKGIQNGNYGIQPIIAEPEISIDIDKSSLLNYGQQSKAIIYGQLSQQGQAIEVAFTVNVKNPPVNIADLQMYMGEQILKRFSHDIRGAQRTNKECYTARFQPIKPNMLRVLMEKDMEEEKYHIEVKVGEQSYRSKKFPANYP